MNKKVMMQIGCFLTMFVLEMIAAYVDPSSVLFTVLLVLALAMIPAFVLVKYIPQAPEEAVEEEPQYAKAA